VSKMQPVHFRAPFTRPVSFAARCALALIVLAGSLFAGCTTTVVEEHPIDDALLEAKVLDLMRKHPQAMIDAINDHQRAQVQAEQETSTAAQRERIAGLDLAALAADSPMRGDSAARVLLVEFSDFQCPFCERAQATLKAFIDAHGAEVKVVFKHLPLTALHPQAVSAARAAWAAHQQGRFWEYHDRLFARQNDLGDAAYTALARELGLDLVRFDRDRKSDAAAQAVARDLELAKTLGLTGTPFFLVNREPVAGAQPLAAFEAAYAKASAALPAQTATP